MADIVPLPARMSGAPPLDDNKADARGIVTSKSEARETALFHRDGLRSRRVRDLTAQKYLLHIDGEGDAQWLDIVDSTRLAIRPSILGAPRQQNNQLRPIVDNLVAHLTTQRYRFIAETKPSREARERAVIDAAVVNHHVRAQRWNQLWASAKYIGAASGFCPVHSMWRDDIAGDPFEAVWAQDDGGNPLQGARPGMIDSWVGNPWDTVFDRGATRNRVHRATYGRVLPADLVRHAFQRDDLEGMDRLPSASLYHRIAGSWGNLATNIHGRGYVVNHGREGEVDQELIALVYDEIPAGILPDWPEGRLRIVALQGVSGMDFENEASVDRAILLWEDALPAGRYSFVNIYTHAGRMDDPLGKPFVADLDDDQIQLNQLESMVAEYLRRSTKAPLSTTGQVDVTTLDMTGDTLFELEDPLGNASLQFLEPPSRHIPVLQAKIERVLEGMYRKGGLQAASRGDLPSGISGKAIVAAQAADDSTFGPLQEQTRFELEKFAELNWRLFRHYADVPQVIDLVGEDLGHLADPEVDRTMLSSSLPQFRLVSGFGVTPEAEAQQLLELLQVVDYKGEGVIEAADVRRLWPDNRLFADKDDPGEVRKRRARVVNNHIRDMSDQALKQFGQQAQMQGIPWQPQMNEPRTVQIARVVAMEVDQLEPAMQDDDLEAHIDTLSLITQDSSENPIARHTAQFRQMQYFQWAAMRMASQQVAAQGGEEGPGGGGGGDQQSEDAGSEAVAQEGGSVSSESMLERDRQVAERARSA